MKHPMVSRMRIEIIIRSTILLIMISLIGCSSLVDLSKREIDRYNLNRDDLSYIQYYLRGKIILRKEDYNKTINIPSHKVKQKEEKKIEDIIINQQTPCVPTYISNNLDTVEVDFGEDLYLKFVESKNGVYQIIETLRDGNRYKYKGEEYIIKYDFGIPVLQFRKSDVSNIDHDRKYIKGKEFE